MIKQIKKVISELELKSNESFSAFSDYIENMREKGNFELLNNAVSRKFGFDYYSYKGITIADYKKIVYNGFKNNGRLGIESVIRKAI
jgi:hypothetical protein